MTSPDLSACIATLRGSRITDRKKAAAELRNFLSNSDVVKELDNPGPRTPTWSEVFSSVTEYLRLEVDKLQKDILSKPNLKLSKINEMRVCFSLVRLVIETADRYKQQLEREHVVTFMVEGLEGNKELTADFLVMLPKSVLSVPAYAEFMTDDHWRSLLSLVTKAYKKLGKDDKMSAAEALDAVVAKSSEYRNLVPLYERILFQFFREALAKDSGVVNEPKLAEPLLSCLTRFSKLMAETCPYQLISLGEEVHETVIGCGSQCKALVCSYFRVLMAVRGSVGRNNPDEDSGWKSQLLGLRRFLVKDFDASMVKGVLLGEKDPDLYVNWFSLAADVLHLIPVDASDLNTTLNVTMNVTNATMMMDGDEPARKRVRLEDRFDLSSVASKLRSYAKPEQLGLLCTLIECLVSRHSSILERGEWISICTELTRELVQKVGTLPAKTLSTALSTLTALLKILGNERHGTTDGDDADSWWKSLCDQFVILSDKILKSVVLSNSSAEGHLLLKMMVENDVLPRKPSPFQLFATANVPPTIEAVRTLAALMKKFVLPGVIECPLAPTEYSRIGRSSREFFLEWLLRVGEGQDLLWFESQPQVLSKVLVGLSLTNPRRIDFSMDDWWLSPWTDDNPLSATNGLRFLRGNDEQGSSLKSPKKERPDVTQFTYSLDTLVLICSKLDEVAKSLLMGNDSSLMDGSMSQNGGGSFYEKSPVTMTAIAKNKVALWFVLQHLLAATRCPEGDVFSSVHDQLRSMSNVLSRSLATSVRTWVSKFTEKFGRSISGREMGFRKSVESMNALMDQILCGMVDFKREYGDCGVCYSADLIDALAELLDLREQDVPPVDSTQRHVRPVSNVDARNGRPISHATDGQSHRPKQPFQVMSSDTRVLKIFSAEVISALDAQTDAATLSENGQLANALDRAWNTLNDFWREGGELMLAFEILRACDIHRATSLRVCEELGKTFAFHLRRFCMYFLNDADDCYVMNKVSLMIEKVLPFMMKLPAECEAVNTVRKKILAVLLQDINEAKYGWGSSARYLRCIVAFYEHLDKNLVDANELRQSLVHICHIPLLGAEEGVVETELMKLKRRVTRMLAFREISAIFQNEMTSVEWRKVSRELMEQLQEIASTPVPERPTPAAQADDMAVHREAIIAGYLSFGKASLTFRPYCLSNLVLWAAENPLFKDEVDNGLGRLTRDLSYPTRRGFVEIHMEAILRKWFARKQTWEGLPVELLGWDNTRDFVGRNGALMFVLSIELCQPAERLFVSRILQKEAPEIAKMAFPDVWVRYTLSSRPGAGDVSAAGLDALRSTITSLGRDNKTPELLKQTSTRVVYALYESLDVVAESSFEPWIQRCLPPALPGHADKAAVKAALSALHMATTDKPGTRPDTLGDMLRDRPELLLRILNRLYSGLMESEGSFERLTWSHRLSCLVEDLNLEKHRHTAVPLMKKFISSLIRHALGRIFGDTLDHWDEFAKKLLTTLVRTESLRSVDTINASVDINDETASNSKDLERALRDIVGRPLTVSTLKLLHDKLLVPGMDALRKLFLSLGKKQGKVFSEDGGVLQALFKTLADVLTDNAASSEMKTLAAKCLGLIGPGDLRTVVFHDGQSSLGCVDGAEKGGVLQAPEAVYFSAFDVMLTHGLFSHDPKSIGRAIDALVEVFSVKRTRGRTQVAEWSNLTGGVRKEFSLMLASFLHLGSDSQSSIVAEGGEREYRLLQFASRSAWSGKSVPHEDWMKKIFEKLQHSDLIKENHLLARCVQFALESSSSVAMAKLFPFAIHAAITLPDDRTYLETVQRRTAVAVNNFLSEHCEMVEAGTASNVAAVDTRSVSVVLDTIQAMRTLEYKDNSKVPGDTTAFLGDLNYLDAARAAQHCGAYLTSLMFLELACDKWFTNPGRTVVDISAESYGPMRQMLEADDNKGRGTLKLLTKAYRTIGDVDGVHGCLQVVELDDDQQVYAETLEMSDDWSSLLSFSDRSGNTPGSLKALKSAGLFGTMASALRSAPTNVEDKTSDILGMRYEVAWRLGRWSDADELMLLDAENQESLPSLKNVTAESTMHKNLFEGFLSFMNRDKEAFTEHVQAALKAAADDPALRALEACATVYPALGRMQAVLEFENVWKLASPATAKQAIQKWEIQDGIPSRFVDSEMTKAVRVVGLCSALNSLEYTGGLHKQLRQALCTTLLSVADAAAKAKRPEAAMNALASLSRHCGSSEELNLIQAEGKMLEAKVCRMTKSNDMGRKILKGLLGTLGNHPIHMAEALTLYGEWTAELMAEPPSSTHAKLNQAIHLLKTNLPEGDSDSNDSARSVASTISLDRYAVQERLANAYLVLAKVADARYRQLTILSNSDAFQEKRKRLEEEQKLKVAMNYHRNISVLLEMDEKSVKQVDEARIEAMATAVSNYGESMRRSTQRKQDLQVFRLVALWLEGKDIPNVLAEAKTIMSKLPSHKFLPLLPQLGARLAGGTHKSSSFQGQLKKLLERCALEHPHHALPILVALSNGNLPVGDKVNLMPLDSDGGSAASTDATVCSNGPAKPSAQKKDVKQIAPEDQSRVAGACQLLHALVGSDPKAVIAKHVEELRNLFIQLIRLANYGLDQATKDKFRTMDYTPVPDHVALPKELRYAAVLTVPLEMRQMTSFDRIPTVRQYETQFSTMSGVNAPKKIKCYGSDGRPYIQLLKGNDDLRQDAVMQQVFRIINSLFEASDDQEVAELQLRTYKIVPLSPRNGVLQWCESAEPISTYLYEAHHRLRPNDMSLAEARNILRSNGAGNPDVRKQKFLEVCARFQPVFRHFMFEKFRGPTKWYERRQAYTKSVAVSSIVGYVLGIGDRHVNNILLDNKTAEVVHIDFGIAFEKGLCLPTPEKVPFRLTRDMIDGMGSLGVSGAFVRSCEKVMHALRHSAGEVVLTVLEVFLWDPLYEWEVSAAKVNQLVDSESGKKMKDLSRKSKANQAAAGDKKDPAKEGTKHNVMASRTLSSVRDKLQGFVDGHLLSEAGQVACVIQQARSSDNLALIYPGWQPFL